MQLNQLCGDTLVFVLVRSCCDVCVLKVVILADLRSVSAEMFSIEAMVRGYYYVLPSQLGCSYLGEQLPPLKRGPGIRKDPFAAAVARSSVTVGHVPISSVCSTFLLRGGTILRQMMVLLALKKFGSLIFAVRDESTKTTKIMN